MHKPQMNPVSARFGQRFSSVPAQRSIVYVKSATLLRSNQKVRELKTFKKKKKKKKKKTPNVFWATFHSCKRPPDQSAF